MKPICSLLFGKGKVDKVCKNLFSVFSWKINFNYFINIKTKIVLDRCVQIYIL